MNVESILTEFRKRRRLLDNVNAHNASPRIKAFVEYCKSVQKIKTIIQNHFDQYPTLSLLEGTSQNKPPKAGSLEEIVSIGLYLMYECSEGKELHSLARKHGIRKVGQNITDENDVYAAMHQYIGHTLDYLEDRIEQSVETPDESNEEQQMSETEQQVKGKGASEFNNERHLSSAFMKYLIEKRKYPKSSMRIVESDRDLGGDINKDIKPHIEISDYEKQKLLAVVEFGLEEDNSTIQMAWNHLVYIDSQLLNADIEGYLVLPGESSLGEQFNIIKFSDNANKILHISLDDFPDYENLRRKAETKTDTPGKKSTLFKFRAGLDLDGSTICNKIIYLAANLGLYAEDVDESYANFRLTGSEKTDNVAVQIHKYGKNETTIALAVVGPKKGTEWKEPELNDFIAKGQFDKLSGYRKNIPGEKAWLNGNLPKTGKREKAGVYVIDREISTIHGEALGGVEKLLKLAKENVKKGGDDKVKGGDEKPGIVETKTIGNVATMADDKVSAKDLLGRTGLAEALSNMFVHTKEMEGFTVALLGDWGAGKSTVIELLKKELGKSKSSEFVFADFNAWRYEHTDNIAAGLAQEVVKALVEGLKFWERQKLRLCFAIREYGRDMLRVVCYVTSAIVILWLVNKLGGESVLKQYGIATGSIALAIYVFINIAHVIEHPLSIKLETYLKLPNYSKHLGLIPVLRRHIDTLCELRLRRTNTKAIETATTKFKRFLFKRWSATKKEMVKTGQLVLFVDDLDRCQYTCIARTLDAIRLVMAAPKVNVFICIDHRIAFRAIERHYRRLGDTGGGRSSADIARDYLGKIIQLPIRLQEPTMNERQAFINDRLFPDVVKSLSRDKDAKGLEAGKATVLPGTKPGKVLPKSPPKEPETEITEKEMRDTEDEREEFRKMAEIFGFTNPRQLLRLRNCYRLIKALELQKTRKEQQELGFEKLKSFMRMLFWQEFLHNRAALLRGACIKTLYDGLDVNEISDKSTKAVLEKVTALVLEVFQERTAYEETAGFVRMVVLPHSEED